jgi:deoxyribose-phosphate aldolase
MTDPRIVEAVVRAVLEKLGAPDPPCACHAVPGSCCPDRLDLMVAEGAERFGLQAFSPDGPASYSRELARRIDHTLLKADASQEQIEKLCGEARRHSFATVCVNPYWVRLCSQLLAGSETAVCTVAGFPLGATPPEVKAFEAARSVADGAAEVDMVMNVGALKSADHRVVARDIAGVVDAVHSGGARVKVIIEAALLTDDEKVKACVLSRAAGADFVKTSTGFGPGGATAADVALMRRVVGPGMGVKAAGGVRDLEGAKAMLQAGADRIGASVGVKIVEESRGAKPSADAPKGY